MSVAAYNTLIKLGGTPTTFTTEAMTGSGAGPYQIDDTTKRVWDRDTVPTFYEDSVAISASDVSSIDYLFGKVTFATSKSGSIYVDGKYMPKTLIAGANSYNLNMSGDLLDDTEFTDSYRSRVYGLRDVSVSVSRFDDLLNTFYDIISGMTSVMIEIQPGGSGDFARGWFVLETENFAGDVGGLETEDLSFVLDGSAEEDFGWGT